MRTSSLVNFRRAIVTGAVTMLAVTGSFASVQAQERPTDGWLHSTVGQQARQPGSDETTDGWLHSNAVELLPKASGKGIDTSLVADSAPVTDGWQHSVIGESARDTAPETTVAATSSDFPTEMTVGSSLLALILMAAGIVVFLKRRHASIAA